MATLTEYASGYEHLGEVESRSAHTARRVFLIEGENAWQDRKTVEGLPQHGEQFPGESSLTVWQREFRPHGAAQSDPNNPWSNCLVFVDYSDRDLEADGSELMRIDHSVEVMTMPGQNTWLSDGEPLDQPLSIIIPIDEISIKVVYITFNRGAINNCRGRINSNVWRGYPAETVLFMGAAEVQQFDSQYGVRYAFDYKFLAKPWSQNMAYRSDIGLWAYPTYVPYATADFSSMGV